MNNPKTFEFNRFLERILHTQTKDFFFIADQTNFTEGTPNYPFRSYFYGIGLIKEGGRTIKIGIDEYTLKTNDLLVIGPGIIRHWLDANYQKEHTAIFFTPEVFQAPLNGTFLTKSKVFRAGIQHVLHLSDEDFLFFDQLLNTIQQQKNNVKIVAPLIIAIIEKIETLHPENQIEDNKFSRKKIISKTFCELINNNYLEKKDVAHYAEKLNITPKYLSEVIKETTGKSPKALIEQLIMQEAKSLLKQTEMNVKEISYWLGFEDPSYFTKAFKVFEGITPFEYRK